MALMRNHAKRRRDVRAAAMAVCSALAVFLSGCGGGGGGGAAGAGGGTGGGPTRTALRIIELTEYKPSETAWYIFDATAADTWYSALGNAAGLRASMTNPFSEVGIFIIPTDNYYNPGVVRFYIDGDSVGTLDLSAAEPFEGYSDEFVSYYMIAEDLDETMHTVTMEIESGAISFDGWRFRYNDNYYDIDCRDSNTYEKATIDEVNKIRNAIEGFAQDNAEYPNPLTEDIHEYLDTATYSYFTTRLENQFSDEPIKDSETFSAGDYHYVYTSGSDYTLTAWGGVDEFYTVTPDSVEAFDLELTVTAPGNHTTTNDTSVRFTGTCTSGASLTISNSRSGDTSIPCTGAFDTYIIVEEGLNNVTLTLSDMYGNSIDLIRQISKDTTAPEIRVLDPYPIPLVGGVRTYTATATPLSIEAYSEPGATVTVNGTSATQDSLGVFTYDMALAAGNNTLTITASDPFGNQNTYTATIIYNP